MVWCVEDDASIRDIELYALSSAGFQTRGFEDADSFWQALSGETPELIILDLMLPGMDGIEILKRLRKSIDYSSIPVILATARGQEYDRVHGLDLGADDYIVKPFSMMEMVSRVRSVLRRSRPSQSPSILSSEGLSLNTDERTVTVDGSRASLTYKEFELLRIFLSHPGIVFTREQLFSDIWKMEYLSDSRTLDSHIRTLRQKIEPYGRMIETVRNVGYRWEARYEK